MRRPLVVSPQFVRTSKRFLARRPGLQGDLRQALVLLEADAFDRRLRTHKSKGTLSGVWSCSAGYGLRTLFRLLPADVSDPQAGESILLLTVGTHDEVY